MVFRREFRGRSILQRGSVPDHLFLQGEKYEHRQKRKSVV